MNRHTVVNKSRVAAIVAMALLLGTGAAVAGDRHHHDGGHNNGHNNGRGHDRHWQPPRVIHHPAPRYYVPAPRVYYAPPPAYYRPSGYYERVYYPAPRYYGGSGVHGTISVDF